MGTLASLTPLLGLLAGHIISLFTKTEIKHGKQHLRLLQHALLAALIPALAFFPETIALCTILFAAFWKTNFPHPAELTPALSVLAALNPASHIPLFLYFIPTGTLHKPKELILPAIGYALVIILSP